MSTSISNFQFRLTGVTGNTFNSHTRQNVKKRVANILYLESPPADSVKLAYVGSKELSPQNNLYIGDRSDELYENAKSNTLSEIVIPYSSGMALESKNTLVTQEFVEAASGKIPLYFKHLIPSTVIPESVRVYDKDFNELSSDKYKLVLEYEWDEDTGTPTGTSCYYLFNSLENSFDSITGSYEVYFVQYTTSVASVETVETELLNNSLAYEPATYEDFWYVTPGALKPWARAYHLEDLILLMPTGGTIGIKYLETKRVSVKYPVDLEDTEPWFPRIINGKFTLQGNALSGGSAIFSIPEFENQAFNPLQPYKTAVLKRAVKVSDRIVKLAHEKLAFGSMFSELYVLFKKDGIVEYAVTTDSSYDGIKYRDFDDNTVTDSNGDIVYWSTSDLLGCDSYSGTIHLNFDVLDSYDIYGTYSYTEEYYTLSGLPMNPVFDSTLSSEFRSVYLVPVSVPNGNSSTQVAAIQWLDISTSGIITDTTQDFVSDGNPNIKIDVSLLTTSGYSLSGVLGMHYSWRATTTATSIINLIPEEAIGVSSTSGFPSSGWLRALDSLDKYRYFKYVSKTDTTFLLDSSSNVPIGIPMIPAGNTLTLVNFIDERTIASNRDYTEEDGFYGGATGTYASVFSKYFVLAELAINPPHAKTDSTLIDVRQDGGGLDPDNYEAAKKLNPEAQWFSDFGSYNGQARPGNAVVVVKLPVSLLEEMTLDQIRAEVRESVPFGVYPLIRFYGYEPRVYSVTPDASSVTIVWEKEGPEFTYDIWYTGHEEAQWTKANDSLLTDGTGTRNTFTISGLDSTKVYTVKITMSDRYYMWWHSYTSYNSIGGGLGLEEDTPVAPFGNTANFQFLIDGAFGFGLGSFGSGAFGGS